MEESRDKDGVEKMNQTQVGSGPAGGKAGFPGLVPRANSCCVLHFT